MLRLMGMGVTFPKNDLSAFTATCLSTDWCVDAKSTNSDPAGRVVASNQYNDRSIVLKNFFKNEFLPRNTLIEFDIKGFLKDSPRYF